MFNFKIIERGKNFPSDDINTGYLRIDHWNDYSFVTMFYLTVFDGKGEKHEIGNVKIGFKGQKEEISTHTKLNKIFHNLTDEYFSLGDGLGFYKNMNALNEELKNKILTSLNDIVLNPSILSDIENESVLNTALLRGVTLSDIHGQFARVLNGLDELSDFDFDFKRRNIEGFSDLNISFNVEVDSIPSTNIHAFIGRNGCGKTTILNEMIEAITEPTNEYVYFTDNDKLKESRIPKGYFRSLVSVSFSAFDPFSPPKDQPDPAKGTQYFYIGLKSAENNQKLKSLEDLRLEFVTALIGCLSSDNKNKIWNSAIEKLSSDQNFANMELNILNTRYEALKKNNPKIQVDNDNFRDCLYKDISKYLSEVVY